MPRQSPVPPEADRLAREITRLVSRNPGDRSVLRHSLGQHPEHVAVGVHRIIVPLLPADPSEHVERAYYAVAALIAAQPRAARDQAVTSAPAAGTADETAADRPPAGNGTPGAVRRANLGCSLARAVHQGGSAKTMEDRLQLLARQDADGIYRHLPRLILQLRGDQVRIDWGVLARDLARWGNQPRLVAKEWTQEFYRASERLAREKNRKAEQADAQAGNEEA
jgi:CRISPR system Cascade subunit CasB